MKEAMEKKTTNPSHSTHSTLPAKLKKFSLSSFIEWFHLDWLVLFIYYPLNSIIVYNYCYNIFFIIHKKENHSGMN